VAIPTIEGILARTVETGNLRTRVLFSGEDQGIPVLFLHGNLASATWWEEVMVRLPRGFRGIAPDQRGYGEADPEAKIDATRGMGDLADDAIALLDHLGLERVHIVGSSLGGNVVWHLLARAPQRLLAATLVAPGSPFGFGSTKDVTGTPCYPDFAGSGAGLINPELVRRLTAGDRSIESPFSPRAALRTLVFGLGFVAAREDDLLSSTLTTHLGEKDYPGDSVRSPNWPFTAPGIWGPNNALSPKYVVPASEIVQAEFKVPILWIRGGKDLAVSDAAASDPGNLGRMGLLPGWPGAEVYPPQPMLSQTRHVLGQYAQAGGRYEEVVLPGSGHVPFLDNPDGFDRAFHSHLAEES
jgi:pimeloyl-ACP methyl ester carboxylesterase